MKFKDQETKLKEFQAIPPDDIVRSFNFENPPKIPIYCEVCGDHYEDFDLTWDDIKFELEHGHGDKDYKWFARCPKHEVKEIVDDPDDDNEDDPE